MSVRVLYQEWTARSGASFSSVSKDAEQYQEAIVRAQIGMDPATPDLPAPCLAEIPDTHVFAKLVQDRTVFIFDEELTLVTFPPSFSVS